ncbi:MnmC family methyltransferase [Pendulispora albinea]|uniref:Methyltransferase n=1 Tax=Pendulispora albinea TaxID=2741071 RepID=A0ABZ2M1H7_9BACT
MPDDVRCEVVTTRSGVRAMRDGETGELMHPVVGPQVEAEQLYVAPSRLAQRLNEGAEGALVLLEVGLGAGSNAAAAWKLSERMPQTARRLTMVSFDRTLAAFELALAEEHAADFGLQGDAATAARTLLASGACETARTSWRLVLGELPFTLASMPPSMADVVFWDPFSPRANPTLWTVAAFAALRRLCRAGATVHTYSRATATRSALLLAGFAVGRGESTGEKAETTVAAVDASDLERPLDGRWLERLARSSAPLPSDAPPDALERIRAMPQFGPV